MAVTAAHAGLQYFELGRPASDARNRVRLCDAFVLTLLAPNSQRVIRECVIELLDGSGHARKFAALSR